MNPEKRELLDELIASLSREPEAWQWNRTDEAEPSQVIHAGGVILWVWNGAARVYKPSEIHFDFFGKRRLRKAFEQWRSVHGAQILGAHEQRAIRLALALLRGQPAVVRAA